jgi:hypothetical protein
MGEALRYKSSLTFKTLNVISILSTEHRGDIVVQGFLENLEALIFT